MKFLLIPFIGASALGISAAACTASDATTKMKDILASDAYREVIGSVGEKAETDVKREATKRGLGAFGGRVGGVVSGVMQDQDNNKENNAAKESAKSVKRITTAMNDAGELIGKQDYAGACRLYESVEKELDAIMAEREADEEEGKKKKKRRRFRG